MSYQSVSVPSLTRGNDKLQPATLWPGERDGPEALSLVAPTARLAPGEKRKRARDGGGGVGWGGGGGEGGRGRGGCKGAKGGREGEGPWESRPSLDHCTVRRRKRSERMTW